MDNVDIIHPLGDLSAIEGKYNDENLTIEICDVPGFINLFAKKGKEAELRKKLGIDATPGEAVQKRDFISLPLSPGQWAFVSLKDKGPGFGEAVQRKVKGLGYVSEQSESRVRIRISGKYARELMSRGCRLDLHSSVISKGFCAQTIMAQVGILIHLVDDDPVFDLYVYSGFARSFWHWLDETAKQFR